MKSFLKFTFSFLYTRDWNTGQMELSRERTVILVVGILLLVLLLLVIGFLQAPIEVANG